MTVNDVLDLVNFHGLSDGSRYLILFLGAVVFATFGVASGMFSCMSRGDVSVSRRDVLIGLLVGFVSATAFVLFFLNLASREEYQSLGNSKYDMTPTEALSELYGIDIEYVGDTRAFSDYSESNLLEENLSQSDFRATIDGEVRALTIETIDSEYRITYVDSEQLVEVSPEVDR